MVSKLAKTEVKPDRSPTRSRSGAAVSTPTCASRPGCKNSAIVSDEPEAMSPKPDSERNTMPDNQLKLPRMKANTPTYSTFLMSRASTRSEEHTSELQSLMRISYAVFCLKKKTKDNQ